MRQLNFFNIVCAGVWIATLARAITYFLFPHSESTIESPLYHATMDFDPSFVQVWALVVMVALMLLLLGFILNKTSFGKSGSMALVACWTFAFVVFIMDGLFMQAISFALLHIFVWASAYWVFGKAIN